jgi:hypothetical protein
MSGSDHVENPQITLRDATSLIRERYFSRDDAYATWVKGKGWRPVRRFEAGWYLSRNPGGSGYTSYGKERLALDEAITASLTGEGEAIGTYTPNPETGKTVVLTLDIDEHAAAQDADGELTKLLRYFKHNLGLPSSYYTVSKSKGGSGFHVSFFFAEPTEAWKARNLAHLFVKEARLQPMTEIFPKSDHPRSYGAQFGVPLSSRWNKKTGGSCFLGLPLSDSVLSTQEGLARLGGSSLWTDTLLQSLSTARGVDLLNPDAFKKKYNAPAGVGAYPAPGEYVAKSPPRSGPYRARWTLELLERFLTGTAGVERLESWSNGASGEGWTHIFHIEACPNSSEHGDNETKAAVMYNDLTGRVGYNCFHAHCREIAWKDCRSMLDPSRTFKLPRTGELIDEPPVDSDQEWEGHSQEPEDWDDWDPGDCAAQDDPEPEEERGQPVDNRGHTEAVRWLMRRAVREKIGGAETRALKLVGRLAKVAACGRCKQELKCPSHGTMEEKHYPCEDRYLCSYCSRRHARKISKYILKHWPTAGIFAKIPIETPGSKQDHDAIRKKYRELFKKKNYAAPRWVTGWDHVLYIGRIEDIEAFDAVGLEWSRASRARLARVASETWFCIAEQALNCIAAAEVPLDLLKLIDNEWVRRKGIHRTAGGQEVDAAIPWFSIVEAREEAKQEAEDKRDGVPHNRCFAIADNGRPCGLAYDADLIFIPTGEVFARRKGNTFDSDEVNERFHSTALESNHYRDSG